MKSDKSIVSRAISQLCIALPQRPKHIDKGEAMGKDILPRTKWRKIKIIHSIILSGSSQDRTKRISNHPNESTRKTNRKRWSTNDTSNWNRAILVQMVSNPRFAGDPQNTSINSASNPWIFSQQTRPIRHGTCGKEVMSIMSPNPYTWKENQSVKNSRASMQKNRKQIYKKE